MTRRRRWLIGLGSAAALAALAVWLVLAFLVPAVVKRELGAVLQAGGFQPVTFDLRRASPWQTDVFGVASTADDRLRIGSATIRYRPLEALHGRIDSVQVEDAQISFTLDASPTTAPATQPIGELPVQKIELKSCVLKLRRGDLALELPLDASLSRAPAGPASVNIHDATLLSKGDIDAEFHGINANLVFQSVLPLATPADQTQQLTIRKATLSGQDFSDVAVNFRSTSHEHFEISSAQLWWCGGLLRAAPFTVAAPYSTVDLAISIEHLDLGQLLKIITQGRATGTGSLSGRIPLNLSGSHVTLWQGSLESDGPGTLRLGESVGTLGQILDQSDPRFTQDAQMKQVKQQILEAMTDFEYDHLTAEPTRREGELVVVVHIQGRGRTGAKQPIDLTLNLRGLEAGLEAYLEVSSRVLGTGRNRK